MFLLFLQIIMDAEETCQRYHIEMVEMGSVRAPRLVDVDGNDLKDATGAYLSIWKPSMKDALEQKEVRCIHNVNGNYRYFVRNSGQIARFQKERDQGSPFPHTRYFIYPDGDYCRPDPTPNHRPGTSRPPVQARAKSP